MRKPGVSAASRRAGAAFLLAGALLLAGSNHAAAQSGGGGCQALQSLLVPGWGQRDQGAHTLADVLVGLEAGFWAGAIVGHRAGRARWADSRRWAALRAQADLAGKDRAWFDHLARYPDWTTYNAVQYSERGDPAAAYPEGEGWQWRWASEADWNHYRVLRRRAREAEALSRLAIGGVIAVRLAGAAAALIHARRRGTPAVEPPDVGAGGAARLQASGHWLPGGGMVHLRLTMPGW